MNTQIPIIMPIDKNYGKQLVVTLYSLFKNAKETTNYKVFIVVPQDSYYEVKATLEKYSEKLKGHEISVIDAGAKFLEGTTCRLAIFPPVVYYRLFADLFITDFDKCIYLDTDIIVCGDLESLYNTELGDAYLAGVKDYSSGCEEGADYVGTRLGLRDARNYINAGVLLMNLKQLREHSLKEAFMEEIQKKHKWADQDVMNKCCEDGILHLPLRYNMRSYYLEDNYSKEQVTKPEGRTYWKNEVENAVIIHYAGLRDKPWNQQIVMAGELWWCYADAILDEQDILDIKGNIKRNISINDVISLCKDKNAVYIYGYTRHAIELVEQLKIAGISNLECFIEQRVIDNEETSILPIRTIETLNGTFDECLFINMGLTARRDITRKLLGCGVKKENILEFHSFLYKNSYYYETLPKAEYEVEEKKILLAEGLECLSYDTELNKKYFLDRWLLYKN